MIPIRLITSERNKEEIMKGLSSNFGQSVLFRVASVLFFLNGIQAGIRNWSIKPVAIFSVTAVCTFMLGQLIARHGAQATWAKYYEYFKRVWGYYTLLIVLVSIGSFLFGFLPIALTCAVGFVMVFSILTVYTLHPS